MTYATSSLPVACGSCGSVIPPGMPIYGVTSAQLPRCSRCAARVGVVLPDAPTGNVEAQATEPLDFSRFDRRAVAKDLRAKIVDWRAKQAQSES